MNAEKKKSINLTDAKRSDGRMTNRAMAEILSHVIGTSVSKSSASYAREFVGGVDDLDQINLIADYFAENGRLPRAEDSHGRSSGSEENVTLKDIYCVIVDIKNKLDDILKTIG